MSIPFDVNEKVENNRSGVYAIVNIKTEKFYIGSAVKLNSRKSQHLHYLRKGKHHSKYLQRSYNKHGVDVFIFKVLEYVEDENNLLEIEQKYLDIYFHTGITYNISPIAGSPLGVKHSEEAKRKMSFAKQNMSDETKKKISEANKGRSFSDETRHKMSEALKGRIFSDETRKRMSEAQKGESRERCFKPVVQLDKNNKFVKRYNSLTDASRETEIGYSNISQCCNGKQKSAGSFIWKFESLYHQN